MKKKGIQKDALIAMGGVSLCLFALVILFSQFGNNNVFRFLSDGISSLFGSIGLFVVTLFVFAIGIYMLLMQKLAKFKLGPNLWGVFVLILAFLMIFSFYGPLDHQVNIGDKSFIISGYVKDDEHSYLTLNNFFETFNYLKNSSPTTFNIALGGGLLGYFLVSLFNSLMTPVGTTIIMWLLIVVGLVLLLHQQIAKLFKKAKKTSSKEESVDTSVEYEPFEETPVLTRQEVSESIVSEPIEPIQREEAPQNDTKALQELSIRTYNNTHTLKKAHFKFDDEIDTEPEQPSFAGNNRVLNSFPGFEEEPVSQPVSQPSMPSFESVTTKSSIPPLSEAIPSPVEEEIVAPEEIIPVEEENIDPLYRPQPKAVIKPPFELPPLSLLDHHEASNDADANKSSCEERVNLINTVFAQLRVGAQAVGYVVGPSVTRFDIQTNPDVSVTTIQRYVPDLSLRLGGVAARFETIVAGKTTSGLEIPNVIRTNVGLRESIEALQKGDKFLRYIPFGKNIAGELVSANMADFPHMLVAGTTGSGKSIFVHSVIMTLLMRNNPDQLRLILIDPKKVEMSYYNDIPHLLCPVITAPRKALIAFKKLVDEMERRYNLFQSNHARDIGDFNRYAKENNIQPLPYIAIFVDEYADLNDECKEIREPVVRLAQKARSAGIHLVIATQRPSVNVIDGVIKANIPTHVALMTSSATDSMTIIGEGGAENLLGNGDMLIECPLISRTSKPRVQGCFVDTFEINRVCDYLRNHYGPQYDPIFLDLEEHTQDVPQADVGQVTVVDKEASEEQLYDIIKGDIVTKQYCSISYIQRTYGVGFPKAGRLFNRLLKDGYVSPEHDARGSKVLKHEESEQQIGSVEQSEFIPNLDVGEEIEEEVPSMEDIKIGENV